MSSGDVPVAVLADGRTVDSLRVVDLRKELELLGLPKSGNKVQLVARLKKALEEQKQQQQQTQHKTEGTKALPDMVIDPNLEGNSIVQEYLALRESQFRNATSPPAAKREPEADNPQDSKQELQQSENIISSAKKPIKTQPEVEPKVVPVSQPPEPQPKPDSLPAQPEAEPEKEVAPEASETVEETKKNILGEVSVDSERTCSKEEPEVVNTVVAADEEEEDDVIDIKGHDEEFRSIEEDAEADEKVAAAPKQVQQPVKSAEKAMDAGAVQPDADKKAGAEGQTAEALPEQLSSADVVPLRRLAFRGQAKPQPAVHRWGSHLERAQSTCVTSKSLIDLIPDVQAFLKEENLKEFKSLEEQIEDDRKREQEQSLGVKRNRSEDYDAAHDLTDTADKSPDIKRSRMDTVDGPAEQMDETVADSSSNVILVRNLVRPFTLKQLKELLNRTGAILDDQFWMDKIKSKCLATYANAANAHETASALNGVKWPSSNPKTLLVKVVQKEERELIMRGEDGFQEKRVAAISETSEKPAVDEVKGDAPKERKHSEKEDRRKAISKPLEELFNKTKAQPAIYWKMKEKT